jgi:hypothetical protein
VDFKKALEDSKSLLVDKIYESGRRGNSADDPLHPLLGVSNEGGFRIIGKKGLPRLIVLTSNMRDPDWPDNVDKENGIFTYYGDNKKPGHELHDTPRYGNLLLRDIFENAHGDRTNRCLVPPVLVFVNTGVFRDVQFIGLAVPGAAAIDSNNDLVAIWKLNKGKRFQNYQAKFTILDVPVVSKSWIEDIKAGKPLSPNSPIAWRQWVETGAYRPLKAPRTIKHRTKEEQLPSDESGAKMIQSIQKYFSSEPVRFEACAAKIAEMVLGDIVSLDLTRPTRDGGRDAIGKYRIGDGDASVLVDFALEAKCFSFGNPVTVKELSRLISRLRHRQFGILVTTSYVASQAYQEIKEDDHPIIIISAWDIVKTLKSNGLSNVESVTAWLNNF